MTPFTLERYRIVELYAELLHCSNMSLLNRSAVFSHMYDSEGRLKGGLSGLEELAQVIAMNSSNERAAENMDETDDETAPSMEFPVRNAAYDDSGSLDSDDDMTDSGDEPSSSDDEAMEEIAMYDETPLSPIPFATSLPPISSSPISESSLVLSPQGQTVPSSPPPSSPSATSNPATPGSDADSGRMTSSRTSGRGSRRSSRSRRRLTIEGSRDTLLPVGEQLKQRWLDENVLGTMIVRNSQVICLKYLLTTATGNVLRIPMEQFST